MMTLGFMRFKQARLTEIFQNLKGTNNMPNFVVTFEVLGRTTITVEAKDWEEAETKATKEVTYDDFVLGDIELIDTEEE